MKLSSAIFSFLLIGSSLLAQDSSRPYFPVVDHCGCGDAYNFRPSSSLNIDKNDLRLGHILKISFPDIQKELKPDTQVANPENPETQKCVAGTIENISWEGGANDPIDLYGKISPQNRAILLEALMLLDDKEDAEVEIEMVLYEYDLKAGKYYKRFYSQNNPIKCFITKEDSVQISESPSSRYEILRPVHYDCRLLLHLKNNLNKEIGFSFQHNGLQFCR